jgi:transcriptional regulator with XRE-family HTH domain
MRRTAELRYSDSLADGLRLARLSSGVGLRETARRVGIEPSNLWRIEKGKFTPTFDLLGRLLAVYKANLNLGPDGLMLTWLQEPDDGDEAS